MGRQLVPDLIEQVDGYLGHGEDEIDLFPANNVLDGLSKILSSLERVGYGDAFGAVPG